MSEMGHERTLVTVPFYVCFTPESGHSQRRPGSGESVVSEVTLYHKNCGTSRNVLGLIRNAGIEPTVIEYLKASPDRQTLLGLIERMGIRVRELLQRKGSPYDELGLDDPKLTDDQLIDAMLANPILINRPIVVTPLGVKLCRPSEIVLDILPTPATATFR
jgi:arsenate reductase (glutaredoxin)